MQAKIYTFFEKMFEKSQKSAPDAEKKFFEEHNFFSNITINHKLILFILHKDCPKSNPKRQTAKKRSNRSAAFDYNILL